MEFWINRNSTWLLIYFNIIFFVQPDINTKFKTLYKYTKDDRFTYNKYNLSMIDPISITGYIAVKFFSYLCLIDVIHVL